MTYKTLIHAFGLCALVTASGCSSVSLNAKSRTVTEAMAAKTSVEIPVDPASASTPPTTGVNESVPAPYDPSLAPDQDADGDGISNIGEFVAGTNPSSKTSTPVITQGGNTNQFQIMTLPGRRYTVEYKTDLQSTEWMVLTNRVGDGSSLSIDTTSDQVRRYYRFRVRME